MTQSSTLSADLAYLRDLAEAGQNAPLLGGRFLTMWGGLATLAYVGHYLLATRAFGPGPDYLWALWGVFAILGIGGQFALQALIPQKAGMASAGNRVQAILWSASGFMLFAYFAGVIGREILFGDGVPGFYWSVPVVIGLYGIGQFVTGAIAGQGALKFAGVAALIGAAVAGTVSGTEYVWLVGAGVAFLAVFLPGLTMLRAEPGETV